MTAMGAPSVATIDYKIRYDMALSQNRPQDAFLTLSPSETYNPAPKSVIPAPILPSPAIDFHLRPVQNCVDLPLI